jgi:hypothetical protein
VDGAVRCGRASDPDGQSAAFEALLDDVEGEAAAGAGAELDSFDFDDDPSDDDPSDDDLSDDDLSDDDPSDDAFSDEPDFERLSVR